LNTAGAYLLHHVISNCAKKICWYVQSFSILR